MPRISILWCLWAVWLGLTSSQAETRFHEFTRKFAQSPDQAQLLTVSFLGSPGTEWLTAGGFQPDGTILLAGNALGPEFDLGAPTTILGQDTPPPASPGPERPGAGRRTQTRPQILSWQHRQATAFIARLDPDLKTLKSVTRLGWRLGGLTDCVVDRTGAIYVCGPANDGITNLAPDSIAFAANTNSVRRGGCAQVYLAKLPAHPTNVAWVRLIKGWSMAPRLELTVEDQVRLFAQDLRLFSAQGELRSTLPFPMGEPEHLAFNPRDQRFARGGEHHWPTGREPYRDPVLHIYRPDGTLQYELYNWDGPFVGLNNLRLVSDSAIRGLRFDPAGNLIVNGWSDGGNSVFTRQPADIRSPANVSGLGFSAWGAGVLSCAYLLRIETTNYTVTGGTLWLSYLAGVNKPNSATINTLEVSVDGSFCFAGSSASGLIQTGNAIGGEPSGSYVAVISPDFTSLRFCSAMPATGQTEVNGSAKWGIATGQWQGKPVALFVSGASAQEREREAPTFRARQTAFGGGTSDGHFVLIDLSLPR